MLQNLSLKQRCWWSSRRAQSTWRGAAMRTRRYRKRCKRRRWPWQGARFTIKAERPFSDENGLKVDDVTGLLDHERGQQADNQEPQDQCRDHLDGAASEGGPWPLGWSAVDRRPCRQGRNGC